MIRVTLILFSRCFWGRRGSGQASVWSRPLCLHNTADKAILGWIHLKDATWLAGGLLRSGRNIMSEIITTRLGHPKNVSSMWTYDTRSDFLNWSLDKLGCHKFWTFWVSSQWTTWSTKGLQVGVMISFLALIYFENNYQCTKKLVSSNQPGVLPLHFSFTLDSRVWFAYIMLTWVLLPSNWCPTQSEFHTSFSRVSLNLYLRCPSVTHNLKELVPATHRTIQLFCIVFSILYIYIFKVALIFESLIYSPLHIPSSSICCKPFLGKI